MLPEHTPKSPRPYCYESGKYLLLPIILDNNMTMLYPNTEYDKRR